MNSNVGEHFFLDKEDGPDPVTGIDKNIYVVIILNPMQQIDLRFDWFEVEKVEIEKVEIELGWKK